MILLLLINNYNFKKNKKNFFASKHVSTAQLSSSVCIRVNTKLIYNKCIHKFNFVFTLFQTEDDS